MCSVISLHLSSRKFIVITPVCKIVLFPHPYLVQAEASWKVKVIWKYNSLSSIDYGSSKVMVRSELVFQSLMAVAHQWINFWLSLVHKVCFSIGIGFIMKTKCTLGLTIPLFINLDQVGGCDSNFILLTSTVHLCYVGYVKIAECVLWDYVYKKYKLEYFFGYNMKYNSILWVVFNNFFAIFFPLICTAYCDLSSLELFLETTFPNFFCFIFIYWNTGDCKSQTYKWSDTYFDMLLKGLTEFFLNILLTVKCQSVIQPRMIRGNFTQVI